MADEPRAYTADEVRAMFLEHIRSMSLYWANLPDKTPHERCEGLAFSILGTIDGVSMGIPAMDLVLRPHPDDKAFNQAEGENWFEDGMVINDVMLHDDPTFRITR